MTTVGQPAPGERRPRAARERLCLAVDLGTTGLEVGLVSFTGRVAWSEQVGLRTVQLSDGTAEQDAEAWWDAVLGTARRAVSEVDPGRRHLDAVGLTGQWASTAPVDGQGRPVAAYVMWMDTRGRRHARRAFGGVLTGCSPAVAVSWIRRNGIPPSLSGDDSLGNFLHLESDRREVADAARWYLEPVDYLAMRLCGAASATPASMTASWLVDTRNGDATHDPKLLRRSGIDPTELPPLVPTGPVVAGVLPEVAAVLDIRAGTPVVSGVPDLHSAGAGAGAVGMYQAHLAISTTSWISCPPPRKRTDPIHQLATVPGLTPDGYLLVDNQDNAGRCVEWFRDALGGSATFEELFALAGTAAPGSSGVILTPWLSAERSPVADRDVRGGSHHFGLGDGPALLAGVAVGTHRLADLASLVRLERELRPDPTSRALHDRPSSGAPRIFRAQRALAARLGDPDA